MPILRWPPDAESLSGTNPDSLFQKEASPAHSLCPEAEALAGRGGDGSGVCRSGSSPLSALSHLSISVLGSTQNIILTG